MIPYARHLLEEDDVAAVVAAMYAAARDGKLAQGPLAASFESALAQRCGAAGGVATSSGTAALEVAFMALAARGTRLAVMPALTFVATASAARRAGLQVVFCDVEPVTLTLDAAAARRIASHLPGPHVVLVGVDYAGMPCDWAALRDVAKAAGWTTLADATHALGATYYGKPVGALADLSCFSFHPAKAIACGEGGAIASSDREILVQAGALADHGRNGYGLATGVGTNARMSELHAALALSQLAKLDRFLARRREIASRYGAALAGADLELPAGAFGGERGRVPAWHLYVVRVDAGRRDAFREALAAQGVGTQVHYRPVCCQPAYASQRACAALPVTHREAARIVSLPMWPGLTDAQVEQVIAAVRACA